MKQCKDCAFSIGEGRYMECGSDEVGARVDGTLRPNFGWRSSCALQQEDGWWTSLTLGACGRSGRFFKQKV